MFRLGLEKLSSTSFSPDVVIFHSGWGLGMHIRTIFKHAKLAAFSEWWFAWDSPEIGFDPGSSYNPSSNLKSRLAERYLNLSQSLEIAESNYIWTATQWQRRQFPQSIQNKMIAIHEGVDTDFFSPKYEDKKLSSEVLITYTTRGLEPIRAFDHFITIVNRLMSLRGDIRLIIVGKDKSSYRPLPRNSKSMKEIALSTFKKSGNSERVAQSIE